MLLLFATGAFDYIRTESRYSLVDESRCSFLYMIKTSGWSFKSAKLVRYSPLQRLRLRSAFARSGCRLSVGAHLCSLRAYQRVTARISGARLWPPYHRVGQNFRSAYPHLGQSRPLLNSTYCARHDCVNFRIRLTLCPNDPQLYSVTHSRGGGCLRNWEVGCALVLIHDSNFRRDEYRVLHRRVWDVTTA